MQRNIFKIFVTQLSIPNPGNFKAWTTYEKIYRGWKWNYCLGSAECDRKYNWGRSIEQSSLVLGSD